MKTTKNTTWAGRLDSIQTLKRNVINIFSDAKKHFYTHAQILERINERIYRDAKYKTLPMYIRSEINGYISANYDLMYREQLEFAHWYDGVFVGKNIQFGAKFKQELLYSNHVYKGTQNKY